MDPVSVKVFLSLLFWQFCMKILHITPDSQQSLRLRVIPSSSHDLHNGSLHVVRWWTPRPANSIPNQFQSTSASGLTQCAFDPVWFSHVCSADAIKVDRMRLEYAFGVQCRQALKDNTCCLSPHRFHFFGGIVNSQSTWGFCGIHVIMIYHAPPYLGPLPSLT